MRIPRPIEIAVPVVCAFLLGAVAMLYPLGLSAAEGPTLRPAEYKPLPVGTVVKYDQWGFHVKSTDGFEIAFRELNVSKWSKIYAIFGRQGSGKYTFVSAATGSESQTMSWNTNLGEKEKTALESLWPLRVGKKVELKFEENFGEGSSGRQRFWICPWKSWERSMSSLTV